MVGNFAAFIGRLTKDPEIRTVGSNTVCNFTLARNRITKDKDHPQSDFVDCVTWNQSAEFLSKYFSKGSRVGVSGELRTRTYEDTNGVKKKTTEIFVNSIEFIDNKSDSNKPKDDIKQNDSEYSESSLDDNSEENDELPF